MGDRIAPMSWFEHDGKEAAGFHVSPLLAAGDGRPDHGPS